MSKEQKEELSQNTVGKKIETKQEAEPEVIVEIGAESVGKIFSERILEKIKLGAMYVGINCDIKEAEKLKNNSTRDKLPTNSIAGDLRELPLKNESADQIWLMNVLGQGFETNPKRVNDPDDDNWSRFKRIENYSYESAFEELSRIVKDGGKIIIGEIYTPTLGIIDADYEEYGFEKKVYQKENLKEFFEEYKISEVIQDFINEYTPTRDQDMPYFLVLTKNKELLKKD